MEQRMAERRKNFKKAFEDPRRRREELRIQIRKSNRDDLLAKKRAQMLNQSDDISPDDPDKDPHAQNNKNPPASLNQLITYHCPMLASGTPDQRLEVARNLRKMLSADKNPPIQQILDAGLVPHLVDSLRRYDEPSLQFEAAWALTNVASGDTRQTQAVVDHGAVPCFVELLNHPQEDVREQSVWALGNIAGDSTPFRDMVLSCGALPLMLKIISVISGQFLSGADPSNRCNESRLGVLRNSTWALSNFCRGKPPPSSDIVIPVLRVVGPLLSIDDHEILSDASWALSYLSDGAKDRIQALLDANLLPRIIELMENSSGHVQTPALRAVGNVATGTDEQTNYLIRLGAIPRLKEMLSSSRKTIRKEACWTVSNITAGTQEQVQSVLDASIIPKILEIIETAEYEVKREAIWCIANAASGGTPLQIEQLVQEGCVGPLCNVLSIGEARVVLIVLESLENILKVGKMRERSEGLDENPYVQIIEEADGFTALEKLQESSNDKIYQKVVSIISDYFPHEEELAVDPTVNANSGAPHTFDFAPGTNPLIPNPYL